MVKIDRASVPPSPLAVAEAFEAAGLEGIDITWRSELGTESGLWHVTVASGNRVSVGALPVHEQSAVGLATYLKGLRGSD